MTTLLKCQKCSSYTLKKEHCGARTETPAPPKYSPVDKYGKYRRMAKVNA